MPKPAQTPPQGTKTKKGKHPAASKSVVPTMIVPREIRTLMRSHGNNPRMQEVVIEFITRSRRTVAPEAVSLLQRSGFDLSQIPKSTLPQVSITNGRVGSESSPELNHGAFRID